MTAMGSGQRSGAGSASAGRLAADCRARYRMTDEQPSVDGGALIRRFYRHTESYETLQGERSRGWLCWPTMMDGMHIVSSA